LITLICYLENKKVFSGYFYAFYGASVSRNFGLCDG
jgi:hypothetical protein